MSVAFDPNEILERTLIELGVDHDGVEPIHGSKTAVYRIVGAGIVAKVSSTFADCLDAEAHNIAALAPFTRRVVQPAEDVPLLVHRDGASVLFTQEIVTDGSTPIDSKLAAELDCFLSEIECVDVEFPLWTEKYELTSATLRDFEGTTADELTALETAFVEPLLERDWKLVPIHGDAYIANAVSTRDEVVWVDLEDLQLGPRALAFALLDVSSAPRLDASELRDFKVYRAWSNAVWDNALATRAGASVGRADASLQRLRAMTNSSGQQ